ncbi:hypothetical protein GWI33_021825 [Rhynchophorus ferrugineus]|uniref:Cytochrome P450 n=1 Tax=Rhynchophorus ferrugineus TaxID=354439 RepID=A0A834MIA4_RHYFE|nr:hypothetical protein GWI33_021825 [Rhynchophorus ferrugineus]
MLWLIISMISSILLVLIYCDIRKPKNFPPGPFWFPLIGSTIQVWRARSRSKSLYEGTAEMSKQFGPVLGLKVGRNPIVIVYGPEAYKEFSTSIVLIGRPDDFYYKLRTWGRRLGIILTDEEFWQEQKRFLLKHLRQFGFGTKNMSHLVETEISCLIDSIDKAIMSEGYTIYDMERFFSVSILNTLWKMMSGKRYSNDDKNMKELQQILSDLFKTVHMVGAPFSYYPILKYIAPGISGYKCFINTHINIWKFLRNEIDYHKKHLDTAQEPTNLIDAYLHVLKVADDGSSYSEDQLVAICMDMFMAGSETTNNTLSFCFLYLILNPDIQEKAQEEIDRVVGSRMINLDDRSRMPYAESIVLEALRMFSGRAFAVPHRALKATKLAGYSIPKDTIITANLHGCMMGPDSGFEEPEKFIPERFLSNGEVHIPDNFYPFGLGKRKCMGESLAKANIFLFTTSLLQKYNFHLLQESPPDMEIVDGVTPAPVHYKAKITRR